MLPQALQQLCTLVIGIADRELPPRFSCNSGQRKADGSLVTEADLVVQAELVVALQQDWPGIKVLGEEMTPAEQQAALQGLSSGLWCIDPLDGTSNFAVGIPYYAVSVALLQDRLPELAVVYDPNRKECFAAAYGRGAWLNGERLKKTSVPTSLASSVALIDFKRLPARLAGRLAADPPYKSQRSFGAVALDWCWLAAGRGHVYLHGRQKLWDYAAGWLVLHEAGGQSVTLSGESVFSTSLKPRSTAAALDPESFAQLKTWLEIPASQDSSATQIG
jgi:myo-inositol-1(or 4)-monophosphatase